MNVSPPASCPMCHKGSWDLVHVYSTPPEGEVLFDFSRTGSYCRKLFQCEQCLHFVSVHSMDTDNLYEGDYVNATYGKNGLKTAFDRIMSLPPERSDNRQRVRRIDDFARTFFGPDKSEPTLLDVGSGLAVFPAAMKEMNWCCTALDPDQRASKHAEDNAQVAAITGDFMKLNDGGRYDVITFNKVLEHVIDPRAMLAKAADYLNPGGFIYIELPDGEGAFTESPLREEFFIDHPHVFSANSMILLSRNAGFTLLSKERIREPSSKYTLFAFVTI